MTDFRATKVTCSSIFPLTQPSWTQNEVLGSSTSSTFKSVNIYKQTNVRLWIMQNFYSPVIVEKAAREQHVLSQDLTILSLYLEGKNVGNSQLKP